MSLRINDLPFLLKVSLAPAFAFAVLIVLAIYANFGLSEAASGITKILDQNMALSREVARTNSAFKQLDGDIYRLLTFYAADSETIDLEKEVEGLKMQAEKVSAGLSVIKGDFGALVDLEEISVVEVELANYVEAIDVVTSMLEIDFTSAVSFVEPFKNNAQKVTEVFERLAKKAGDNATTSAATIQDDVSGIQSTLLFGTTIAGLLVAAISYLIGRMTTSSIREIANATTKVASGDTEFEIVTLERKDELGSVVAALTQFRNQMGENERLQAEQKRLEVQAAEDEQLMREADKAKENERSEQQKEAQAQMERERVETMLRLAATLEERVNSTVTKLENSASGLEATAVGLSAISDTTKNKTKHVYSSSGQASSNVQTVAAAAEEMASSIGEITRQVEQSSQISRQAIDETKVANTRVSSLAEAANKINDVISLIHDIAGQTNLLALNATIESARAGEAGKGFAVVASEVKTLAGQTAKATDEISSLVNSIQKETRDTVAAIGSVSKIIDKIGENTTAISNSISEQSSATAEISRNAQETAQGTNAVTLAIETVNEAVDASSDGAVQVLRTSNDLKQETETLLSEVAEIIAELKNSTSSGNKETDHS